MEIGWLLLILSMLWLAAFGALPGRAAEPAPVVVPQDQTERR